jgi:hypothetical protein
VSPGCGGLTLLAKGTWYCLVCNDHVLICFLTFGQHIPGKQDASPLRVTLTDAPHAYLPTAMLVVMYWEVGHPASVQTCRTRQHLSKNGGESVTPQRCNRNFTTHHQTQCVPIMSPTFYASTFSHFCMDGVISNNVFVRCYVQQVLHCYKDC